MAQSAYPNDDHNGGDLGNAEYERWGTAVGETGLIGVPSDTSHGFVDGSTFAAKIRADKRAFVRGQLVDSGDTGVSFALTANSSGTTRIDMVVAGLDRSTGDASYYLVTGTPGAGAPAPQQDEDFAGTGKWELPVALYTVPNAATSSSITCQPIGWYLGERTYLCTESTRPPHRFGRRIKQYPGGDEYTSDGSNWVSTAVADTGWVAAPWNTGWGGGGDAKIRKVNGMVTLTGSWKRTGGAVPANTLTGVATLPATYRPSVQVSYLAYLGGGRLGMGHIGANGAVSMEFFIAPIATNDFATVGTVTWPAAS